MYLDLAQRLGEAGRKHVARKFSLEAFGESLEKTLTDLVGQQKESSLSWMFYSSIVLIVVAIVTCNEYKMYL